MNILFLSTENPYPPDHGHHIRTYNIIKCLSQKHEIFFIGFTGEQDIEAEHQLRRYCRIVQIFLIPEIQKKWSFLWSLFKNLFVTQPFSVNKYYRKEAIEYIREILKEGRIDLVHVDMLHLGIYFEQISSFPNILVCHNVESAMLARKSAITKNRFARTYLKIQTQKLINFEQRIIPKYQKTIVVSESDLCALQQLVPRGRYEIVSNGVDVDYFKESRFRKGKHEICWVGGMKDADNSDAVTCFIEEIWPLIRAKMPDVRVCFVGKYPPRKLRRASFSVPNITLAGYVKDVRPYINRASVFIAPLRSGGGTKLKVLNAMSMQKAVVTTSIGAEGITAVHDQHLCICNDPQEFAWKTIYLLKNPQEARRIGRNARELIEKQYDWRVIDTKMDAIYQGLISYR